MANFRATVEDFFLVDGRQLISALFREGVPTVGMQVAIGDATCAISWIEQPRVHPSTGKKHEWYDKFDCLTGAPARPFYHLCLEPCKKSGFVAQRGDEVRQISETFTFGDNESLCQHLLELVRSGKKTATCGALRDFEDGGEPMPVVGRRDIALNWDGTSALVIETTEVTIEKFSNVPEDFALAEGENDTREEWAADHQRYFERNGGFDPDMMLVCERFKLVEDLRDAR